MLRKIMIALLILFVSMGFAGACEQDKNCKCDCTCEPTQKQVDIAVEKYLNNHWNQLVCDVTVKIQKWMLCNINLFQGKPGVNGTNGLNGTNGNDGVNGTNGSNGENGLNSTNGVDGTNGTNGINGTDGLNGTNTIEIYNFTTETIQTIEQTPSKINEIGMQETGVPLGGIILGMLLIVGGIVTVLSKK
jgi:hypothetical protein